MEQYTRETFEPYVGQVLLFERPANAQGVFGDRVELELLEVTRSKSGSPGPGFREPFSLLFALRSQEPLGPVLHSIAHDDFEPCGWFLSRVIVPGGDPRTPYYQAVFG